MQGSPRIFLLVALAIASPATAHQERPLPSVNIEFAALIPKMQGVIILAQGAAPGPTAATSAAAPASNPADFARHPRPAGPRGSLPLGVTAAEAGQAIGSQMGSLVMMLRVCGWAEEEARFKGAFGLQTHERLGFTAQEAAGAFDHASAMAGEMMQAFGSNPATMNIMHLQVCKPALRDTLTQSIASGNLF